MENNTKKEKANKTKCEIWKRRTSLEQYLFIIIIIIFIVLLVFIGLFAHIKIKQKQESICLTAVCKEEAGRILQLIDFTVNPCEHFYNFACGNFMKYRNGKAIVSYYDELNEYMTSLAKEPLQKPEQKNEPEFIKKLKTYYQSCLKKKSSIRESFEYILKEMELNEWNLANPEQLPLEELLAKVVIYNSVLFFRISPSYDHEYLQYIKLDKGHIFMGNYKSFNISNEESLLEVKKQYKTLFQIVFSVLNLKVNDREKYIEKIIDLEIALYEIIQKDRNDNSTKLTLSQLQTDSDCNQLSWTNLFKNIYHYSDRADNYSDSILMKVQSLEYIKDVCTFLKERDRRDLYNLIIWNSLIYQLSDENEIISNIINDVFEDSDSTKKNITMKYKMKWETCIDTLQFPYYVALQYLLLKSEAINKVNERIAKIQSYIKEIMNMADETFAKEKWLDDDSRNFTRFKIKNMEYEIGFSKVLLDEKYLNELFHSLNITDIYLHNVFQMKKFSFIDNFFWGPITQLLHTDSIVNPFEANAYFDDLHGKEIILIPLGILQPPFYAHEAPNYLNYGAIGSVIGHEIFHGFDSLEKQTENKEDEENYHKKYERKIDWPETFLDEYKKRKECLIKQYSEFPLSENVTLDGNSTASENIADNCGLFHSFWAYEKYLKKYGEEPKLPGLDFTNKQMFFIRSSQMECEKVYFMHEEYKFASHSPGIYRSLGPLMNFPEFAKEFNCPLNSFMNPEVKCNLFGR